ncbi:MAG: hypothetical protein PWP72_568 [Thermoanaerobacter sp.]|nr:hypothetical protein [Thermoanaerobacter sp.]
MIVAREKPYYHSPPEKGSAPAGYPRPQERPREYLALALVIVLVFALGIIISIFYSRVLITGYQITRLQEELAEMEKETRSLAEEVSRLSSLERVEVVATTRLGMVKPGEDQVLLVKATGDSRERQQESRPATKPGPGGEERPRNAGEHHWILQALTDLVMHRLSG